MIIEKEDPNVIESPVPKYTPNSCPDIKDEFRIITTEGEDLEFCDVFKTASEVSHKHNEHATFET